MDQHELVAALIQLAGELGRTPLRDEFYARYSKAAWAINKYYNRQYNTLILAAGLELNAKAKFKPSEIFKKDISHHLQDYEPKAIQRSKKYPKILIIGDIHFPFHHKKCLDAVHEFAKENKNDLSYIIQIGDLYDQYSHAKFPRSHNVFTPKDEEKLARQLAENMWKKFKEDCPNAKLIQILGNHDARPLKRVLESLPQMEHWVEKYFQELMSFENVETLLNAREEYKIEDIFFNHGYASKLGEHRDHYLNNLVVGHSHTGGVSFRQIHGKILWELNVGYVADQFSKGLSYTPTRTVKWTLGWGLIDAQGPRFIPY